LLPVWSRRLLLCNDAVSSRTLAPKAQWHRPTVDLSTRRRPFRAAPDLRPIGRTVRGRIGVQRGDRRLKDVSPGPPPRPSHDQVVSHGPWPPTRSVAALLTFRSATGLGDGHIQGVDVVHHPPRVRRDLAICTASGSPATVRTGFAFCCVRPTKTDTRTERQTDPSVTAGERSAGSRTNYTRSIRICCRLGMRSGMPEPPAGRLTGCLTRR
jgi:hypothetical protein